MRRRFVAPLLFAPLILVATEAAHALSYRIAYSQPQVRASVLERTGHAYLAYGTAALGTALATVLVALGLRARQTRRGRVARVSVRAWWFALIPLLVFVLQEHVERLASTGAVPWSASLERTFLIGLVLVLPFGLLAYAFGRFLLRMADQLGQVSTARSPRFWPVAAAPISCPASTPPRIPLLALCQASRAPPFLAL